MDIIDLDRYHINRYQKGTMYLVIIILGISRLLPSSF
jgi:hypothetical protein